MYQRGRHGEGGDGLRHRWPSRGPDHPAEWTCTLKPVEEAAGWVGKQISQQPGLGGKFREFPPGPPFSR